jgi:asparagine synthase (glutamine-hydrolysing)
VTHRSILDARRLAGRLARKVPGRGGEEGGNDVQQVRARLRRARARLKAAQDEVASLKTELRATRDSLRHPFPGFRVDDRVHGVIDQVRDEKLTYLSEKNLEALAVMVAEADRAGRPGLVIEAGTALGGSAIVMAAAKSPERKMLVYDVFGMIPEPSGRDGADVHKRYEKIVSGESKGVGGGEYYGYRDDLYTEVTESFARLGVPVGENGVDLVKGLFQDTIHLDEPVALAHLDGDWYESTMVCLERIAPLLVPGGRIVLDDYWAWSGCRAAVDDYTADKPDLHVERRAKVQIVRT